jgi:hypothetical protein
MRNVMLVLGRFCSRVWFKVQATNHWLNFSRLVAVKSLTLRKRMFIVHKRNDQFSVCTNPAFFVTRKDSTLDLDYWIAEAELSKTDCEIPFCCSQ